MKLVFLHDSFLVIKHEFTDIYILKTTLIFELVQVLKKYIRSRKENVFTTYKDILGCPSVSGCTETLVFHNLKILYFHTWGSIDLQLLIPFPHKGIRSKGHFFRALFCHSENISFQDLNIFIQNIFVFLGRCKGRKYYVTLLFQNP